MIIHYKYHHLQKSICPGITLFLLVINFTLRCQLHPSVGSMAAMSSVCLAAGQHLLKHNPDDVIAHAQC